MWNQKSFKCERVTQTFQTQNKMTAGSQEQGQGRKVVNLLGPIMSSLRCGFQSRWQVEWDCSIFLDRETVKAKFNMRKTMFVVTMSPGYCCFHEYWSYSQFIKAISYRRRQARTAQENAGVYRNLFFFLEGEIMALYLSSSSDLHTNMMSVKFGYQNDTLFLAFILCCLLF